MRSTLVTALSALVLLIGCASKSTVPVQAGTVVVATEATYVLGARTTESVSEMLAIIRAAKIQEPIVVNWSVRGGNESVRKAAEARASELRSALRNAGFTVSAAAVGNEVY